MTRLFLICISLAIICTSCIANADPIDDSISQFKDDQIMCLKKKVALNEEMISLLVTSEMYKGYISTTKDTLAASKIKDKIKEMDNRYNQIIRLKQKYTCEDNADDEFLDSMNINKNMIKDFDNDN